MHVCILEHHPYASALRIGSHHVAALLLRAGHTVTWASHPRSWLHTAVGQGRPRRTLHDDGVRELCPRAVLPYIGCPGLGSLWWGRHWLRLGGGGSPAAELASQHYDLVWLSDFTILSLLHRLSYDRLVLRVFDQIDEFRWMPKSIIELFDEHAGAADLIIASSRSVQRRLADCDIASRYVPNGADVDGLAPPRLASSKRPLRVAYAGAFGPWLDVAALRSWARACPDVEFLLIGPSRARDWRGLDNVRRVGPVGREQLFELLGGVRLGLIPFLDSALTEGVHPLKLYDYLASGCAVLSSNLPEVSAREDAVWKYASPDQGLELLRQMIARDWDTHGLFELAIANRWESRLGPVFAELGWRESA